jgi:hypothetical protein
MMVVEIEREYWLFQKNQRDNEINSLSNGVFLRTRQRVCQFIIGLVLAVTFRLHERLAKSSHVIFLSQWTGKEAFPFPEILHMILHYEQLFPSEIDLFL